MQTLNTKKILIIDDERDVCYLFSEILRRKDFDIGFVNSLSDAITALQKNTPYFLFLDNKLPDGLGLDFIPYIKKNYPDIKVIMITAQDSPSEKKIAYDRGADFFIAKPFSREIINNAIEKLSQQPN